METNTNFQADVVIRNNTWTLTKHVLHSINKTAGKIDAKVYGPIVEAKTVQLPPTPPPPPPSDYGFFTIVGIIVCGILALAAVIAIFVGYSNGSISGRDLIGF